MEGISLIQEVKINICKEYRCSTVYSNNDEGENFKIDVSFCDDGFACITLDLYNDIGDYLETRKLNHCTGDCSLPFNLISDPEPDCDCIVQSTL